MYILDLADQYICISGVTDTDEQLFGEKNTHLQIEKFHDLKLHLVFIVAQRTITNWRFYLILSPFTCYLPVSPQTPWPTYYLTSKWEVLMYGWHLV